MNLRNTHLREPFIQSIYCLQGLGVRERQRIRTQAHNVTMLLMQPVVGDVGPSAQDIKKAPPVRERSQERPGVFLQPMIEVIFG